MSDENNTEALFAMQEAIEGIYKLLEARFPKAAEKAKIAVDEMKAARTAIAAQKAAERFSRTISDLSNDELRDFGTALDEASKSTDTFGDKLKSGGKKAVDGLVTVITASIPFIGGMVGVAINETMKTLTQSLTAERAGLGEMFRTLGDGTVSQGLDNLRSGLDLTYDGMLEILSKYSSGVGILGGKGFANTTLALKDSFVQLGYSVAEGTEAIARYAEEQSSYIALNNLSQNQQTKMFHDHLQQVSKFSGALKLSREEVERQTSVENETAENKLYLAQLTTEQMDAYKAAKASVGEALALEAVGAIRNEKLYGTAAKSETYRNSMATGYNEKIDSVKNSIAAGDDGKFLDKGYVSGLAEVTDGQLRMASYLSDNTDMQQSLFFESTVHLSEVATKLSHVVDAYMTAANDESVKTAIEVDNTIPYLLGIIQEYVRDMAGALLGVDFSDPDTNTSEKIKELREKLGSKLKEMGDSSIKFLSSINEIAQKIYEFMTLGPGGAAAKAVKDSATSVGKTLGVNGTAAALDDYFGTNFWTGRSDEQRATDDAAKPKKQPAAIPMPINVDKTNATKNPFSNVPDGSKKAAADLARIQEQRRRDDAENARRDAQLKEKTATEKVAVTPIISEEYAKRIAVATEAQNLLLAKNNLLTEKLLRGGSGFVGA